MEQKMKDVFYVREALPHKDSITPQKKLDLYGVESLRDGELLMLCLGISQDKAGSILERYSLSELASLPFPQLQKTLGKAHARELACGLELAKRVLHKGLGIQPVIACPGDTIPYLSSIKDQKKEHFACLYLNARNQVIHQEIVSVGSLSASIVHPREVFLVAVQHSAAAVLLSHNHPSSDVSPSQDDIELTRRLMKAGEIMGIEILDHIIISSHDFLSLKERGLM
jgi:DNA repair protein RadC